jgi:hypothetical protein
MGLELKESYYCYCLTLMERVGREGYRGKSEKESYDIATLTNSLVESVGREGPRGRSEKGLEVK